MQIDSPDNQYDAYISIGVVEHRIDGPEPFLVEANRVLKPGGIAFISVPYVNPLRRFKSLLGCYKHQVTEKEIFYQYAFQKKRVL